MSLEDLFEVKTGLIRVSGYVIKLSKVKNSVLRIFCKGDKLDSEEVDKSISKLNRKFFRVVANKYKAPKEAVASISLKSEIMNSDIEVEDIEVEVFGEGDILSGNVADDIKNSLTLSAGNLLHKRRYFPYNSYED